ASCSTHASKAWCPRTGRSTTRARSGSGSAVTRASVSGRLLLSMVWLHTEFACHPLLPNPRGFSLPATGSAPERVHQMPEAYEPAELNELSEDEKHLAKLGYRQDLHRSWSGFSNFAISFSIISILAGCLTNFGAGFNNGGPISISWTWAILSALILIVGFTMSELLSAYPTSGGIYWWASKLGRARA